MVGGTGKPDLPPGILFHFSLDLHIFSFDFVPFGGFHGARRGFGLGFPVSHSLPRLPLFLVHMSETGEVSTL